jgi:hypothetical protein
MLAYAYITGVTGVDIVVDKDRAISKAVAVIRIPVIVRAIAIPVMGESIKGTPGIAKMQPKTYAGIRSGVVVIEIGTVETAIASPMRRAVIMGEIIVVKTSKTMTCIPFGCCVIFVIECIFRAVVVAVFISLFIIVLIPINIITIGFISLGALVSLFGIGARRSWFIRYSMDPLRVLKLRVATGQKE